MIGYPCIGDCPVAPFPHLLTDQAQYFQRLADVKRDREMQQRAEKEHKLRVVAGVQIIRKRCTVGLRDTLQDEFNTKDIPLIISAIKKLVGPGDSTEVIERLELQWLTMTKALEEDMQQAFQRLERCARDLASYGAQYNKNSRAKIACARRMLKVDSRWESVWLHLFRTAENEGNSWEELKESVYKAYNSFSSNKSASKAGKAEKTEKADKGAAKTFTDQEIALMTTLVDASVKKRADEVAAKKKADAAAKKATAKTAPKSEDKVETKERMPQEEWLKLQECHNCHQKGHLKRDCPNPKDVKTAAAITEEPVEEDDFEDESASADVLSWCCDPSEPMPVANAVQITAARGEASQDDHDRDDSGTSNGAVLSPKCCVTTVGVTHDIDDDVSEEVVSSAVTVEMTRKKRILDSGTTNHLNAEVINRMTDFYPRKERIGLADDTQSVAAHGRGTLGICKDTLWAPDLSYTLISPGKFDLEGKYTIFGGGAGIVLSEECSAAISSLIQSCAESVLMRAELKCGLYEVTSELVPSASVAVPTKPFTFAENRTEIRGKYGTTRPGSTGSLNPLDLLHLRCGHVSERTLKAALKNNAIIGAQTTYEVCKNLHLSFCEACHRGQMKADHIPRGVSDYSRLKPFEVIGIDPVPLSTTTINQGKYINIGVCLATNFMFAYETRSNGNQVEVIKRVLRDFCIPNGHTLRKVFSDHHSVFLCEEVQQFLLDKMIVYESSPPYEHGRNFVEGIAVRVLLDKARVMLIDSGLGASIAGLAIRTAAMIHNVLPHPEGSLLTPFERVTGRRPDVSGLRPFGARVMFRRSTEERAQVQDPRWADKSSPGIIVGYSTVVAGGYLILTSKRRLLTRRQVVAEEGRPEQTLPVYADCYKRGQPLTERASLEAASVPEDAVSAHKQPVARSEPHFTRGSVRTEAEKERHTAILCTTSMACSCCVPSFEESSDGAEKSILLPPAPRNIKQAEASPEAHLWKVAIEKERAVMLDPQHPKYEEYNGVPTRFMRAVMSLRPSHLGNGEIKYKARLCPDGSTQVKGIDYSESYSPTARRELFYMILHIAAVKNYDLFQFDIGSAYLEVPARHNQYMRMTDDMIRLGFSSTRFVKLLVNFYGTQDAGRNWFEYFVFLLLEFGLEQSKEEPCLFTLSEGEGAEKKMLVVLLFVDDGAYTGNWPEKMRELEEFLRNKVHKIVIKELDKFLGLTVRRDRAQHKAFISVPEYVPDLLEKYQFTGGKSGATVDTPIPLSLQYRGMRGTDKPIWGVTGALLYLSATVWPELKVPVSLLATGGATPSVNHTKGAMQALRYLKTHETGRELVLGGTDEVSLVTYSDASYDPKDDSLFQYGYVMALGMYSGAYNITCKRSKTVSHSSLQSEMKALCEAAKEVSADRLLLEELGCPQVEPTKLYTDSQCAIDLVMNHYGYHPKCRHFNRDTNYVRECVLAGVIVVLKINTKHNPADLTTKLSSAAEIERHVSACLRGLKGDEEFQGSDNE